MMDLVECRSDDQYAQRPTAIYWDGQRLPVHIVLAEWKTPEGKSFRVLLQDLRIFNLVYNFELDNWEIHAA